MLRVALLLAFLGHLLILGLHANTTFGGSGSTYHRYSLQKEAAEDAQRAVDDLIEKAESGVSGSDAIRELPVATERMTFETDRLVAVRERLYRRVGIIAVLAITAPLWLLAYSRMVKKSGNAPT